MAVGGLPAGAAEGPADGPRPPRPYPWGYGFGAGQPGHPGNRGADVGTSGASAHGGNGGSSEPPSPDVCGSWRFGIRACNYPDLPATPSASAGPPTVSPAQLAAEAWRRLPIPAPEVATAPPRGSNGLVGLAEWFWVTNWSTRSARVQAGGTWAQVTARPTGLTIDPGSGQRSITCDGPGMPYDRRRPAGSQRSDCSYTYVRSSAGLPNAAYTVTVTVTWGGTWAGSGGTGGTLPALSRSTSFPLRVAEGQTVTGG